MQEDWALRGLTLHQLKDIITDIYASKFKADVRYLTVTDPVGLRSLSVYLQTRSTVSKHSYPGVSSDVTCPHVLHVLHAYD